VFQPWPCDASRLEEEIERLTAELETAESVAQMAAHDRDEALENLTHAEQEYERLQTATRSILWMAEAYAEGGGSGGPEMRDYQIAAEIIGEG
jgi:chromosome segregation ATPase